MNLLCEKDIIVNKKNITLKMTMKSLYKTQKELAYKGIFELVSNLDKMDLILIVSLIKNCASEHITDDQILEADLEIIDIYTWATACISSILVKEDNPSEKK